MIQLSVINIQLYFLYFANSSILKIIKLRLNKMEGQRSKEKFIQNSLNHRVDIIKNKNSQIDQITAHCKLDHMTPYCDQITDLKKNKSCYFSSYSPPKASNNYNNLAMQRGLQHFRKYDNNSIMLPTIIVNDSQYNNSYKGKNGQSPARSKQKDSFFMKLNWALKPISQYEKKFVKRDGSKFNKQNKIRVNYDTIEIFELPQGAKRISNYANDYKVHKVSNDSTLSQKNKDHLFGKQSKQIQIGISQYKRRYDSMMFDLKEQKQTASLYKKNSVKKSKHTVL